MTARSAKIIRVKVRRLPHGEGLPLPAYQTADAAGLDLVAAVAADAPMVLKRGERHLIPTGIAFELPAGTEAQVRPRSGLALKHGVTVLNSPGTIDADYRGEIGVILINHGPAPFTVQRGDRIAQVVFAPVARANLIEATALSQTARGAGGFGSTGIERTKNSNVKKPRKRVSPARTPTQNARPKSRR